MNQLHSIADAHTDAQDLISNFREKFLIPQHGGRDALYFTGNSLGLQPKRQRAHYNKSLMIGQSTG